LIHIIDVIHHYSLSEYFDMIPVVPITKELHISVIVCVRIIIDRGMLCMKRMIVPTLVLFLACLSFFMMPMDTSALESGVYRYDFTDNSGVRITGYFGEESGHLVIPSEIGGHKVTRIDTSAFANKPNLHWVTLPEGLLTLGDYAFSNCANLKSITLPDSLLEIGD